jgi:hypothetical protein
VKLIGAFNKFNPFRALKTKACIYFADQPDNISMRLDVESKTTLFDAGNLHNIVDKVEQQFVLVNYYMGKMFALFNSQVILEQ